MDMKNSFEEYLNQHYNEIFHYVHKQTNDIEVTKDLTQDIFVKLHQSFDKFDPEKASFRTWMYHIAHNHVVNHFRRADNRNKIEMDDWFVETLKSSDDMVKQLIQSDDAKYVIKIMKETLNKKHFKMMSLYFFSDLDIEQIADILHCQTKTVYNTINVSIKKIRSKTEGYFHE